jgi:hypothetical protein
MFLSLLVFPSIFLKYLISAACRWLLCLEDKDHDWHPYVIIGAYVVYIRVVWFSCYKMSSQFFLRKFNKIMWKHQKSYNGYACIS